MTSTSLQGSGGNQEPQLVPPCFPVPWQLTEQTPRPQACWQPGSLQLCCSENTSLSSFPYRAFRACSLQLCCSENTSVPSLTELLEPVPCSDVPSQSAATSRFLASTSILFPDELEALLPLTASLHLSRETSKDHDVSSMHCTFCL